MPYKAYYQTHKLACLKHEQDRRKRNGKAINARAYILRKKPKYVAANIIRQMQYNNRKRVWIQEFKNRPCSDCQGWFEPYQMDFDHRDPKTKLFDIGSERGRSYKSLNLEIRKCDVVCANCHRERTYNYMKQRNDHHAYMNHI